MSLEELALDTKIEEVIKANRLSCVDMDKITEKVIMLIHKQKELTDLRKEIFDALVCKNGGCMNCAQSAVEIGSLIRDI